MWRNYKFALNSWAVLCIGILKKRKTQQLAKFSHFFRNEKQLQYQSQFQMTENYLEAPIINWYLMVLFLQCLISLKQWFFLFVRKIKWKFQTKWRTQESSLATLLVIQCTHCPTNLKCKNKNSRIQDQAQHSFHYQKRHMNKLNDVLITRQY